jgi:hypothetical protein
MTHTTPHNKSTFNAFVLAGLLVFGIVSETKTMETFDCQVCIHPRIATLFAMLLGFSVAILLDYKLYGKSPKKYLNYKLKYYINTGTINSIDQLYPRNER